MYYRMETSVGTFGTKTKVHSNEEEKNQQGRKQTNTKNRRYIRVKQMVCILTNRSSWLLCKQREKKHRLKNKDTFRDGSLNVCDERDSLMSFIELAFQF